MVKKAEQTSAELKDVSRELYIFRSSLGKVCQVSLLWHMWDMCNRDIQNGNLCLKWLNRCQREDKIVLIRDPKKFESCR